jgi:hypothetical protein
MSTQWKNILRFVHVNYSRIKLKEFCLDPTSLTCTSQLLACRRQEQNSLQLCRLSCDALLTANPGAHMFSCHVSLVFFNVRQVPFFFFEDYWPVIFIEYLLIWVWCLLMIKSRLCFLGKECHPGCGVHISLHLYQVAKMSIWFICGGVNFGKDGICCVSPLYVKLLFFPL